MDYVKTVFSKYADFNGRARRAEYWYFVLFINLALIGLQMLTVMLVQSAPTLAMILGLLYLVGCLAMIIPSLAVAVRRMHDVGKSGWYLLIPIYSFILAVTEGEKGSNQYGPDPKNPENDPTQHLVS